METKNADAVKQAIKAELGVLVKNFNKRKFIQQEKFSAMEKKRRSLQARMAMLEAQIQVCERQIAAAPEGEFRDKFVARREKYRIGLEETKKTAEKVSIVAEETTAALVAAYDAFLSKLNERLQAVS